METMEEEKVVSVKFYDTVIEAEIDSSVLKENGIECIYNDATVVGVFPIFDNKERGIELMVFEKDLERANQLLANYHSVDKKKSESEETVKE